MAIAGPLIYAGTLCVAYATAKYRIACKASHSKEAPVHVTSDSALASGTKPENKKSKSEKKSSNSTPFLNDTRSIKALGNSTPSLDDTRSTKTSSNICSTDETESGNVNASKLSQTETKRVEAWLDSHIMDDSTLSPLYQKMQPVPEAPDYVESIFKTLHELSTNLNPEPDDFLKAHDSRADGALRRNRKRAASEKAGTLPPSKMKKKGLSPLSESKALNVCGKSNQGIESAIAAS